MHSTAAILYIFFDQINKYNVWGPHHSCMLCSLQPFFLPNREVFLSDRYGWHCILTNRLQMQFVTILWPDHLAVVCNRACSVHRAVLAEWTFRGYQGSPDCTMLLIWVPCHACYAGLLEFASHLLNILKLIAEDQRGRKKWILWISTGSNLICYQ